MFLNGKTTSLPRRFRLVFTSFLNHPSLPFADAVTEQTIEEAFDQEGVSFGEDEDAVYTPAITLWAFLSQVLFKGEQRSCVAAVARIGVLLVALKRSPCAGNTGAYCRARSKLSPMAIRRIATDIADGCERQADEGLAVAQSTCVYARRNHGQHAGHAGEPGGLSAGTYPARGARLSRRPGGRAVVAGHGDAHRHGHGPLRRQGDGRNGRWRVNYSAGSSRATSCWRTGTTVRTS